jgi:hypothetical protein
LAKLNATKSPRDNPILAGFDRLLSDCHSGNEKEEREMETVGYIIQDNNGYAIFGIGATADAAWSMVVDCVGYFHDGRDNTISPQEARETQFRTYPATAALLNAVDEMGGAIAWDIVDGVACTREEGEIAA